MGWLNAACIISYLYDVAGRSEDAHNITWERVQFKEGYAEVRIPSGKTSSRRGVLT